MDIKIKDLSEPRNPKFSLQELFIEIVRNNLESYTYLEIELLVWPNKENQLNNNGEFIYIFHSYNDDAIKLRLDVEANLLFISVYGLDKFVYSLEQRLWFNVYQMPKDNFLHIENIRNIISNSSLGYKKLFDCISRRNIINDFLKVTGLYRKIAKLAPIENKEKISKLIKNCISGKYNKEAKANNFIKGWEIAYNSYNI